MDQNLEKQISELKEKMGFYLSRAVSSPLIPPEHAYFSLTNRCNLRCQMCSIAKNTGRIDQELSVSKIKEIILQIKGLGIKHIIFSGGEPLLRQDLFEILEFAIGNGIAMTDIITNGMLLNDNSLMRLVEVGLNHITISLDGLKENTDRIRGNGIFDKAQENMDKLNYYKNKYNSFLPTLGINFTVMDCNVDDILPMVEFASSKKCNIILFQPLLFSNTKMHRKRRNILWPSEENILKLKDIMEEVISLKRQGTGAGIYTSDNVLKAIPDYFSGKRLNGSFKCHEAIKRVVITCDGKLWSCVGVYGDLNHDDLETIWFSKKAMAVRKTVKKCKGHCLQDCVYFPSNVISEINDFMDLFLSRDEEKQEVKTKILEMIEYYSGAVEALKRNYNLNFFEWMAFKNEINRIVSLKERIENLPP